MERMPTHGVDGWELVAYERDDDGVEELTYERAGKRFVVLRNERTKGPRSYLVVPPPRGLMKRFNEAARGFVDALGGKDRARRLLYGPGAE
jgi:hypothetical protein